MQLAGGKKKKENQKSWIILVRKIKRSVLGFASGCIPIYLLNARDGVFLTVLCHRSAVSQKILSLTLLRAIVTGTFRGQHFALFPP